MATREKQIVVEIDLTRVAAAVAAAGLLAVVLWPLANGPAVADAEVAPASSATLATAAAALRQFYLTQTNIHMGNDALTACAPGYHMASLWEILDPSELSYNTSLGHTLADSGQGPPTGVHGWIRTGGTNASGGLAGTANCNAWTTAYHYSYGTTASLQDDWQTQPPLFVWDATSDLSTDCEKPNRVWCVED